MASTRTAVVILSITGLLSACESSSSTFPTAPTIPSPPVNAVPAPPSVGGTLSGIVYETTESGRIPVVDVQVYCDACGPQGHSSSVTAADGSYRFDGAPGGRTTVLLAKPGYKLPRPDWVGTGGWMGGINVVVSNDTQFDIQIVRE